MIDDDDSAAGAARDAKLPRPIQEHLGRRLRTELHVEAEKPSFLGESSVPPQFESLVRKLEAGEGGQRQGYEAVRRALIGGEQPAETTIRPVAEKPAQRPRIKPRA
jgi:hypothetical protein